MLNRPMRLKRLAWLCRNYQTPLGDISRELLQDTCLPLVTINSYDQLLSHLKNEHNVSLLCIDAFNLLWMEWEWELRK